MLKDHYIFPFNEVAKNSKIIIYGASKIGFHFVKQIRRLNYCDFLIVDKNFKQIQQLDGLTVYHPEKILEWEYDKIVIASVDYNDEIYNTLISLNVPKQKIVREIIIYEYAPKLITPDPENGAAWNDYYERAEKAAKKQFERYFKPILSKYEDISLDNVLDFACGWGRMANIVSNLSKSVTCCDVNANAIEFVKNRFQDHKVCAFKFVCNKVTTGSLEPLGFANNSFSFIYSWDAMVHFSYRWLDFYIKEFYRILDNNAYAMIHHSNYANADTFDIKSENWFDNPHGRSLVGQDDIKFIAQNHGFTVAEQRIIDWGESGLDCISLLKKQV